MKLRNRSANHRLVGRTGGAAPRSWIGRSGFQAARDRRGEKRVKADGRGGRSGEKTEEENSQ